MPISLSASIYHHPDLETLEVAETDAGFQVEAQPRDLGRRPGRHSLGWRTVTVRDMPLYSHGARGYRSCTVVVKYLRHENKTGGLIKTLPASICSKQGLTRRLVEYIEVRACAEPAQWTATATGVPVSTVRALQDRYLTRLERQLTPRAARHLAIDEVHVGRTKLGLGAHNRRRGLGVISTPDGDRVLALVPDAGGRAIEQALRGLADLDRVEVVTMDGAIQYRDAVRRVLPGVAIVYDRWHLQTQAVEAAQTARKRYIVTVPRKQRAKLKSQHVLIGSRYHTLSDENRRLLDALLAAAPLLAEAYRLKEQFSQIYDCCRSVSGAIDAYAAWLNSFPEPDADPASARSVLARETAKLFKPLITEIENRWEDVFAWFEVAPGPSGRRPSQGHAENMNRRIKQIYSRSNGISFESLRRRLLYRRDVLRTEYMAGLDRLDPADAPALPPLPDPAVVAQEKAKDSRGRAMRRRRAAVPANDDGATPAGNTAAA